MSVNPTDASAGNEVDDDVVEKLITMNEYKGNEEFKNEADDAMELETMRLMVKLITI